MKPRAQRWHAVRHPLRLTVRHGWRWGRGCLVSPRGTIFESRFTKIGLMVRKRLDFQLATER